MRFNLSCIVFQDFSQSPVSLVVIGNGQNLTLLNFLFQFCVCDAWIGFLEFVFYFLSLLDKHTFNPANHYHWQYYSLILVCLKLTTKFFGSFPEFSCKI